MTLKRLLFRLVFLCLLIHGLVSNPLKTEDEIPSGSCFSDSDNDDEDLEPKKELPSGGCFAVSGTGRGKKCIFPFVVQGKRYKECVGSADKDKGGKWCATEVKEGREVKEQGYCGEDCPGVKPDSYTRLGDGGFYKINNKRLSYTLAASECKDQGAHLAVDDSSAAPIMTHYNTGSSGKGASGSLKYWIGGAYCEKAGGWVWPDGSSIEDAKWSSGQPDKDKNCLATNFRSKERWFATKCWRKFPFLCQQTNVTNGDTLAVDMRGDHVWATQWEDDIALKIYEKWLKAAGGEKGMSCTRLRSIIHVFGEAPVGWDELTKDAISLAKKEDMWPEVCDNNVNNTVKACKTAISGVADAKNMNEGFDKINKWVDYLKKGQANFMKGVEEKTCKNALFSFIDQVFKFKSNIQEAIDCVPEIPECVASVNKHKKIYSKHMYQAMRKGRAKSDKAKIAAIEKLGNQTELGYKNTTFGGISQEPRYTPEKLKNFFSKPMIHGKRLMQRDVNDTDYNPAKLFALAQAPFIGGLSGSILEIFRLVDAYVGKKYTLGDKEVVMEKIDDKTALLLMALLDLGGHHSITETAIASYEWGLLKDVSVPFTADTDLRNIAVECREKLPNKYLDFLRSLESVVDGLEY